MKLHHIGIVVNNIQESMGELTKFLKFEKIKIGKPIKDGINDVKESLPLIKLTITPQKTKKDP